MFLVIFEASRELPPALSLPKGQSRAVGRDARPYLMTDSPTPSPDFPILPVSPFSACPLADRFSRQFFHVAGPDPSLQTDRRTRRTATFRTNFRSASSGRAGRPTLPDRFTYPVSHPSPSPYLPTAPSRPFQPPAVLTVARCGPTPPGSARPPPHRPPFHRLPTHRPPRHLRCTFQPGDPLGSTHLP